MRSRAECIRVLSEVAEYSDDEITMNNDMIREIANDAAAHLKQARKVTCENRKLREKVRNGRKGAK